MAYYLFAFVLLVGSISAKANQCPLPGEVFSREFQNYIGETTEKTLTREGSETVSATGLLKGVITAGSWKNYKITYCREITENYSEEVCDVISIDMALGRGNSYFKSFYDLSIVTLKRAQLFSEKVHFFNELPSADRLEFARQIIVYLSKHASVDGIPNSWTKFEMAINKAVSDGDIPQSVADEVLTAHKEKNIEILGFKPFPGVKITEDVGNGTVAKMFNLQRPASVRATLIYTSLEGVTEETAKKLTSSFVTFASVSGIPENWDQVVIMLKESNASGAISNEELTAVTEVNEEVNRKNLGFEQTATLCKMEPRSRKKNIIDARSEQVFDKNITKNFEVTLATAPLLLGEKEEYVLQFHSFGDINFRANSSYNKFVVSNYSDNKGEVSMLVTGTRQQVNVKNAIAAKIFQEGKAFTIALQNKGFNPKIGGKVFVKVEYYESVRFWPDSKIGTQTYEVVDGNEVTINPKLILKNGKNKVRLKVSMQIVGSQFYNQNFSQALEFEN